MNERLTYPRLQEYLTNMVPARSDEMQKMEAIAESTNFPIIGPAAGYYCYQIARMIEARHIFELGSGYGYSTAWFAKAVQENGGGTVHHVVWDSRLSKQAQQHLCILGFNDIVEYHVAEAVQTLQHQTKTFDLIFNDINKVAYATSLPAIAEKLRDGGVLITDNMLWNGQVFDSDDSSESTTAIRELTKLLTNDPGWITTLAPVRDGLIIAYKVPS
jgi:predicted O-methyltransferase YrrM